MYIVLIVSSLDTSLNQERVKYVWVDPFLVGYVTYKATKLYLLMIMLVYFQITDTDLMSDLQSEFWNRRLQYKQKKNTSALIGLFPFLVCWSIQKPELFSISCFLYYESLSKGLHYHLPLALSSKTSYWTSLFALKIYLFNDSKSVNQ